MPHPLAPDLTQLTMEELTNKYNELAGKLTQAYRFGPMGVVPQMQMLLDDYRMEMTIRQQKQMEDMQKSSNKFKSIIDIK